MYGGDEVKTLEKLRIYAASAAFIALTAVKLLSPAYAQELRQEVFWEGLSLAAPWMS